MDLGRTYDFSSFSDEELLRLYREGQPRAFEVLVNRYRKELFYFLARFTNNQSTADDVFQDTFLQVHLSIDKFDITRRFRPWLFTIATNKARDFLRRNSRREAISLSGSVEESDEQKPAFIDLMEADVALPEEDAQRKETHQLVRQAVGRLPDHLKEILLLAYFHRFSYQEIAQMLSIPVGTVKSRLHTAVGTFAKQWKAKFDAQPPLPKIDGH